MIEPYLLIQSKLTPNFKSGKQMGLIGPVEMSKSLDKWRRAKLLRSEDSSKALKYI